VPAARSNDELVKRAIDFEKRGMWAEACRALEDLGRKDRANSIIRDAYHRCLRRLHLTIRHSDGEYRHALSRLSGAQALDVYSQVLGVLSSAHPDRGRATYTALFQSGITELYNALEEPSFRRTYFADADDASIAAFRARLKSWPLTRVSNKAEARDQAMAIARAASREGVPMRGAAKAALLLELAAGACNSLDEYCLFVTPGQLGLLQAALRGKLVSVGFEMGAPDGKLQITQVAPNSPAAEKGLRRGDAVLKISGTSVEDLPCELAAEKLRGEPGTTVKVTVFRGGLALDVELTRRMAPLPSVEEAPSLDDGSIRHLRINYFSEKTAEEVKAYLSAASAAGDLKGVVLDLRGNPGGLFDSAVAVAELFLPEGVIVIGSSPLKKYHRTYKVETPGLYHTLPAVVLIDGDTASAAEVLAGAIKETRGEARLASVVGQTSYGKGTIQCLIPLEKTALERAALKLTVARLYSPADLPFTGRGVIPDILMEGAAPQAVLAAGVEELRRLIGRSSMMMPPSPMMPSPMS
jgi:carboxyl-terminal processing protease